MRDFLLSPISSTHISPILGQYSKADMKQLLTLHSGVSVSPLLSLAKAMVCPGVMYGCESWNIKKVECEEVDALELWCWEKTLERPFNSKEIKPVHPKGNQSLIFIGRIDSEAEIQILWPFDVKN